MILMSLEYSGFVPKDSPDEMLTVRYRPAQIFSDWGQDDESKIEAVGQAKYEENLLDAKKNFVE